LASAARWSAQSFPRTTTLAMWRERSRACSPVLRGPRDRRRRRRIHRRDGRYPSSLARSNPLHRGLAAARSTGIRVARLDGDPAVGLVYGDAALFTETSPGTATLHSSWAHHPSGKILPWLVRQNVVPSPTPMVRRELFDQVGPFDETLSACEDWDMWIRIARAERRRRCPWDWQHGAELSRHALMTAYDLTFYLFTAFHSRPRSCRQVPHRRRLGERSR
jgi:hypothetical protein